MPWTIYCQKGETLTASTSVWVHFSCYNRKRKKGRRKMNEKKALEGREDDKDEGKEEVKE